MFNDLREFIDKVKELGEYEVVEGADWDLEIGAISDLAGLTPNPKLLMFDKIKGYETGYRVVTNLFATHRRTALALGLPLEAGGIELVKALRGKLDAIKPIPPVEVETGPVKENILTGADIDLFKFPTPKWHDLDGGRYIGTGSIVIQRDPDEGWVNASCYRVQVHDKAKATVMTIPIHHGTAIKKKYWDRGQSCPVAIACGQDPMLWAPAIWEIVPWGVSEYDIAGGLRGEPVQVTRGVTTDLPIPATAEIVIEGEIVPPEVETLTEGPFGEWSGYYAGGRKQEPVIRVTSILHRNNPIIQGNPPSRFPLVWTLATPILRSAMVWNDLERQLPGVSGVWQVEDATSRGMVIVSLKQEYPGHAKQAALIAASSRCEVQTRWVIVVDEDIDPSNMSEVLWALGTRVNPEASIDIITGCTDSPLNPSLPPEKRERAELTHSTATVLACKPYHWIKDFPPAIETSPELAKQVKEKWSKLFS